MSAFRCSCGYVAAGPGELGDHWGEAFIPADDRDVAGVVHAEAARDASAGPLAYACLCGDAFGVLARLDDHLLSAFATADRVGLDGRSHAPAA